ncbi:MAG: hypothetical protein WD757_01670 [Actinomycetota bacterium]
MDWLLLAALGIIWAAFLLPSRGRRNSPRTSVEEFERDLDLLADTERENPGRWVVAPRKGSAFIGARRRERVRQQERRRRVLTILAEAIGVTFLIGLVPPLRAMWAFTALAVGLLTLYVWALVHLRQATESRAVLATEKVQAAAAENGYYSMAEGHHQQDDAALLNLGVGDEEELVHVFVREDGLEAAGV